MKRTVFASFALMSFAYCCNAYSEETNVRPMFGLRAGVDINIPGEWRNSDGGIDMYKQGLGANLGGVCNVFLGKGFYLEPGASIYYDQYSYDDLDVYDQQGNLVKSDPGIYKIGVRVPVVAGYTFDVSDRFSLTVFTGPELNWSFAGGYVLKHRDKVNWPRDPFGEFRRVDLAWRIGFGVPLDGFYSLGVPLKGFVISIDAAIGVTDLMKTPDLSFRENRVTVGLTYYF